MTAYTGQVQVDFTHDPTSASFTWVDLTNRARAASYRRGRSYELSQVETGSGTAKLRNDDGALDPTNGASTYSPNVIPFRRFQHNVTVTGPGTVPIFTGLVERWPQEWDTGYGYAPVQVVDMFAWLSLAQLRSCYEQEVLADSPTAFYPLTEASGSTSAGDISGNSVAAATITQSPYGAGEYAFGASGVDSLTGLSLTPPSMAFSNSSAATYLQCPAAVLPGTGPLSVELWFNAPVQTPGIFEELFRAGSSGGGLALEIGNPASPVAEFVVTGSVASASAVAHYAAPNGLIDGQWHHIVGVFEADLKTAHLYVDGALAATATAGSALGWAHGGDAVQVGAVVIPGVELNSQFSGTVLGLATYSSALSAGRVAAHYTAGSTAFAGDTADARIARILGYVGWTATTALDACVTTMLGATDLSGKNALDAIQDVQAAEGGTFFTSKAGVLTYKSRRTRMLTTTSAATFGENTAGGEVPWLDIAFDFDPTYIYNDVQITRTGGSPAAAKSTTSQAHYGQRTLAQTLNIQSDAEAQDAANWLLNAHLAPHLRIRSVVIDCLATPGAWAAVLPLEIGSRVTVKKRPANGTTITVNAFVESIAWDIVDGRSAKCTLELSPIPLQALILNDATYGVIDGTNRLGY